MNGRILFLIASAAATAWAQIQVPPLGWMLDTQGALHPVSGVIASASLGHAISSDPLAGARRNNGLTRGQLTRAALAPGVLSFACSATLCLAKTDAAIVDTSEATAPVAAPSGRALIAIAGPGAFVYFPDSQRLVRWHDGQLDPIDFAPDGTILSLRATRGGFDYAVRRDGRVWIEHDSIDDASVITLSGLGSAAGPSDQVMLVTGGIVIGAADHTAIVRDDGTTLSFPLCGAAQMLAMSESYVEIIAAAADPAIGPGSGAPANESATWILRIDVGREQIAMLPGVSQ